MKFENKEGENSISANILFVKFYLFEMSATNMVFFQTQIKWKRVLCISKSKIIFDIVTSAKILYW